VCQELEGEGAVSGSLVISRLRVLGGRIAEHAKSTFRQWRSQPENSPRADSYSKIFATNDSLHVLSKNGRTTNKNQDVTF